MARAACAGGSVWEPHRDNGPMPATLLPLFPLSLVMLPSAALPLHIYEDRYKEMMGELIASRGEFGIVLVRDEGIVSIGCTATVEQVVERYSDGRLDIIVLGRRRFSIESLNDEKSYLRASVGFFNDEEAGEVPRELRTRVILAYERLRVTLSAQSSDEPVAPKAQLDLPQMSFQVGHLISDLSKRQTLLGLRSEVARLEYLVSVLPEYTERQEQTRLAKRVAPLNGHAKHVVDH